ncbi:MAG: hypothetical protein GY871_14255 [Actinomycetales bacterium]|nr:hypothetical protein [Actinomycetales bacterium]MCP4892506.1 hypothetical protein [Actinomycetales bacterium]
MRRLVWTAIGAAGGIWAYRKSSEWLDQARDQGVALTIQQAALNTTQVAHRLSAVIAERGQQSDRGQQSGPEQQPGRADGIDPGGRS